MRIRASAIVTPVQITAAAGDYSPGGLDQAVVLRLSSDASRNISGIQAPVSPDGTFLLLLNVGAQDIVLTHADSNSHYANRFDNPGDASVTLQSGDRIWIFYDVTLERWCPLGI
jgi:hypothetical protein